MSECEHEMIWVGSYTNLRCAKCNESYTTIQTEKVAQLQAELEALRQAAVEHITAYESPWDTNEDVERANKTYDNLAALVKGEQE